MIKKERQDHILEIVKQRKYCTVNFLSKQLYVAPITIRRDLIEMEAAGLITRCYGGAAIPEHENREVPFDLRNTSNASVKEHLAKKAAKLIHTGDVVFLDASSTVSRLTQHLSQEQNLTVITNSTLVAEKLNKLTCGNAVALIGAYIIIPGKREIIILFLNYHKICK